MKNKSLVFNIVFFIGVITLILFLNAEMCCAASYNATQVLAGGNTEYRLYNGSQHFMTVILTSQGAISIRPHPGVDINGWGSSLYLQPFLPGATLKYTNIRNVVANESGIRVIADGNVSLGSSQTYGYWSSDMFYSYNSELKEIRGFGNYSINLGGNLSSATGDLNIYKLASNYLNDVPLLYGGIGDTGDMYNAIVSGSNGYPGFTWDPVTQPSHFPSGYTQNLSIDVSGNLYNVNTTAQNYSAIAAAYKPSMKVVLNSRDSGIRMMFGGIYNLAEAQQFWQDNIGVTPLIQQPTTKTNYTFDVTFYSKAPAGDGFVYWENRSIKIVNGKIKVNGSDFLIKGMDYAPWLAGTGPEPSYNYFPNENDDVTALVNSAGKIFVKDYNSDGRIEAWEVIQYDLETMKNQGVNTVRIYASGDWHDVNLNGIQDSGERVKGDMPDWVIDRLLNYSNANGMKVIIGYWVQDEDLGLMICNWTDLEIAKQAFGRIVAKYKDNPAVLGWAIGNEVHGSWNHAWFTWNVDINDYLNKLYSYVKTIDGGNKPIIYAKYVSENDSFNNLDAEIMAINAGTNSAALITALGEFAINGQQGKAYMLGEYGDVLSDSDGLWNLSQQYAGGAFLEFNNVWWKTGGTDFGTVTMYRENKADRYGKVLYLYKNQTALCYSDLDCGNDSWLNSQYCNGSYVYDSYKEYICNNPATSSASCSQTTENKIRQTCVSGCSSGSCLANPAGLVFYEPFDSAPGMSLNGGTWYNVGSMVDSDFETGKIGGALRTNGGEYVIFPVNLSQSNLNEGTMEFLFRTFSNPAKHGLAEIDGAEGLANYSYMMGFINSGAYMELGHGGQSSSWIDLSNSTWYDPNWHHLALTWKCANQTSSSFQLYLDGIAGYVGYPSTCPNASILSPIKVIVGTSYFYGAGESLFDEMKIFNYTKNQSKILEDYSGYFGPMCSANSDCGNDTWYNAPYCSGNNSYDYITKYKCSNPGTIQAICSHSFVSQLKQTCSYGCLNGTCNSSPPINTTNCTLATDAMVIMNNTKLCNAQYYLPSGITIGAMGITLDCNGATLDGNFTNNSAFGIAINQKAVTIVKNCIIKRYIVGIRNWDSYGSIYQNNTLTNNSIYGIYLDNAGGQSITDNSFIKNTNGGFYAFWAGSSGTIERNLFDGNYAGVIIDWDAQNFMVRNNSFTNNSIGIKSECAYGTHPAYNNNYTNNTITKNSYGIFTCNSRNNTIIGNNVVNNSIGLYLDDHQDIVYWNNMINNTIQVTTTYENYWNSSKSGNYWSTYDTPSEGCIDSDSNGVCDSPFNVTNATLNIDYYPVTKQNGWNNVTNPIINCSTNLECGNNSWLSNPFCSSGNVWNTFKVYTCNNPGTVSSYCSSSLVNQTQTNCSYGCSNGSCNAPIINCSTNLECGTNGYVGSPSCSNNDSYQNYITYSCNNANTTSSYCSNNTVLQLKQDCGDDSYGNWTANSCEGSNVIRTRMAYFRGCIFGSCNLNTTTEKQVVQNCSYGCTSGSCNSAPTGCLVPVDPVVITQSTTLCKGTYTLPNGIRITGNNLTFDCNGSTIYGNYTTYGVYGTGLDRVTMRGCYMDLMSGIGLFDSINSVVDNNSFWHYTIYANGTNNTIKNNAAKLKISGTGFVISGNSATDTVQSVYFSNLYNSSIVGNNFYVDTSSNAVAVGIDTVGGLVIENNSISSPGYGIWCTNNCNNITLRGNSFQQSTSHSMPPLLTAVYGTGFSGSRIYRNNFFRSNTSSIGSLNSWDFNGSGNYWSIYDEPLEGCSDLNGDNICDSPYVLDTNNRDNYPYTAQNGWTLNVTALNCSTNSQCGSDSWLNNKYCNSGNVWDSFRTYTCNNPGTVSSYCSNSPVNQSRQNCSYGCTSGSCNNLTIVPIVITITSPTTADTYSSSTNSIFNISGTVSGGTGGINRVVLKTNLGEIDNCSGAGGTFTCQNIELLSGANTLTVTAYDNNGNSSSDSLAITFTSAYPQLDEAAMRAGMAIQEIDMNDNLVPGTTQTVRWKILSYYPLLSSMKATFPTNQSANINGKLVGVEPGRWKIYDRNSKVFVFEANWTVPQIPGDARIRFPAALTDGYAYMNANIPGGVDSRPYLTDGKEVLRTITSGGTNPGLYSENTTVVPPYFDTLNQSILRAGGTITRIDMPDNLTHGSTVRIRYDVLSYVPLLSRFKVKTASGADIQADTSLINTTLGRWSIYTFTSKVYTFEYNWTVPNDPGDARIRFMNAQSDGYAYMNGNIPGGVDSRPYLTDGKEVLRTIV